MRKTRVICIATTLLFVKLGMAEPFPPQEDTLRLTLERAVEIALSPEGNVGLRLAAESIEEAEAVHSQARAARRPLIESYVSERNMVLNLEAVGIRSDDAAFALLMLPRRIGPFSSFDARVAARYNVVDPGAQKRREAAQAGVSVAQAQTEQTRNAVAFEIARLYVLALRNKEQLATAQANVELAEALLGFAERHNEAGTGDAIDVARAKSQLADEQYQWESARSRQEIAYLRLLSAMGKSLDTQLELTDSLSIEPLETATLDQSAEKARASRADLRTQGQRIEKARLDDEAIHSERMPTLSVFADYGALNTDTNQPVLTHAVGLSVRFPVFDGSRRASRRAAVSSRIRSEELQRKQLLDQIDLQIHEAQRRLYLTASRIRVAEEGLTLAHEELARARRRHESGVANGLEVTDAQTRLRRAQGNRIEALYEHNRARIDLVEAQGDVRLLLEK